MSIGSTIKRLRREKEITQEQLAEYLGITSRAISQWECDRTAPDISQIPALCHIFDVSSDVLLGIDIEKNNQEIQRYLDEATELGYLGKRSERTLLLRKANQKFPRDYKIMESLADSLVCEYSREGIKEYDEVFRLCRRILAECTDSMIRYKAMQTLGIAYVYAGKKDEMAQLAKEMPHTYFSYEHFMMYHWKGDSDFKEFQEYLSFLIYSTVDMIGLAAGQRHDNGEFVYSIQDKIRLWETQVSLLEALFPDGDFQYKAQLGEIACGFLGTAHLRKGDLEGAWHWIEKSAGFAIHFDTYDFNAPHTSPALRGNSDGGWIMEDQGNCCQAMLDWLTTDDELAALRADNRYHILVDRLKRVARKP